MKIQLTGNEVTSIMKALHEQGMISITIKGINEMVKCGVLDGEMDTHTSDVTVIIDDSYVIETSKGFIELMKLFMDTIERTEQIASDMEQRTTGIVENLMKRKAMKTSNNIEGIDLDDFIAYMNKKSGGNVIYSECWGEIPKHKYTEPTNDEILRSMFRMRGDDDSE